LSDPTVLKAAGTGILTSMDAITDVPMPANEPVHEYAPDSPERTRLVTTLDRLAAAAIRYYMLKFTLNSMIVFDFDAATQATGVSRSTASRLSPLRRNAPTSAPKRA